MDSGDTKSLNLEQERAVVLGASGVSGQGCPQKQSRRQGLGCLLVITRNRCERMESMERMEEGLGQIQRRCHEGSSGPYY